MAYKWVMGWHSEAELLLPMVPPTLGGPPVFRLSSGGYLQPQQ